MSPQGRHGPRRGPFGSLGEFPLGGTARSAKGAQ
jgi:hypothetical protein